MLDRAVVVGEKGWGAVRGKGREMFYCGNDLGDGEMFDMKCI